MLARISLLPVLLLALTPACDPKDAGEPGANEPKAEVVEDFSQAGEDCDGSMLSAECQIDGVAGVEFCAWSDDDYKMLWTGCLTDTCDTEGAQRACDGGLQYCAQFALEDGDIEQRWGTCGDEGECKIGESRECFPDSEDFEGLTMSCSADIDGRPMWQTSGCDTPLVLSFDGGLEFSAAPTTAAAFDIHGGTGTCVRADWPTAATPWLALDRDGDGVIAGGQELFGSATRLSAGTGPHNGFHALAELDSDRDGKVSPADARWNELVLWADHDADRRSTQWELLPLASFEIVEIDLGYTDRPSCDAQGNCARERAAFVYRTGGVQRSGDVIDVRVACE